MRIFVFIVFYNCSFFLFLFFLASSLQQQFAQQPAEREEQEQEEQVEPVVVEGRFCGRATGRWLGKFIDTDSVLLTGISKLEREHEGIKDHRIPLTVHLGFPEGANLIEGLRIG
ncbi:MAG: hypothetical protein DRP02_05165 [Candidatus Gerdarchaeota archaeon]|nr:MAG: hypothetical protein DRP02_05165 [Candidatus Gerdarchaeota archaeon]